MISAPWSDRQVAVLNERQKRGFLHPYTCPNRGDGNHHDNGNDLGCLVATNAGWICPDCDYTQTWAHDVSLPMQEEKK